MRRIRNRCRLHAHHPQVVSTGIPPLQQRQLRAVTPTAIPVERNRLQTVSTFPPLQSQVTPQTSLMPLVWPVPHGQQSSSHQPRRKSLSLKQPHTTDDDIIMVSASDKPSPSTNRKGKGPHVKRKTRTPPFEATPLKVITKQAKATSAGAACPADPRPTRYQASVWKFINQKSDEGSPAPPATPSQSSQYDSYNPRRTTS